MCFEKYIDDIKYCVENFDINPENYKKYSPKDLGIDADDSNEIYLKEKLDLSNLSISFKKNAKNCFIFIGKNIVDKSNFQRKLYITFHKTNQFCYIGNNVSICDVRVNIQDNNNFVIIGNGVIVSTPKGSWITGLQSGNDSNGIIIGDDCLIAQDNVIRATDGHHIIDLITNQQINKSIKPIVIEPYCWIGQRVLILKNVRIAACSIVGLGAVVTKSCDKFSIISGVPAVTKSIYGKLWRRDNSKKAQEIFEKYKKRFILNKDDK